MQPIPLPALEKISHTRWVQQLFPSCIWSLQHPNEKVIYLTFDDGPMHKITPWVLDELRRYQAKATFFCIGANVLLYPEIYQSILDSGHAVGNHTQNHKNGWKSLYREYLNEVETASKNIKSNLFRPPYGKLKPLQLRAIKKKYQIIMWSFLTADYQANLDTSKVLEEMKNKVETGAILVFHDSFKAEKNLKVLLPATLSYYSSLGYEFRALPSETTITHP